MFWIGSKEAIKAAEKTASFKVVGLPEFMDGVELPEEDWITNRWAIPVETVESGVWCIPALKNMPTPTGCTLVWDVELPNAGP